MVGAGGADQARMMQAVIQKNNLMKQPMAVSLKGGVSGAEAAMHIKSSDGDPNKVLIAYSLIYMLPLSAKIPFNWRDLTPVFQKVTQTAEYKDYVEKQALKPIFPTGKDMLKFLEEDDKLNASLMNEAGFVAK